jgi:hypothetical protein
MLPFNSATPIRKKGEMLSKLVSHSHSSFREFSGRPDLSPVSVHLYPGKIKGVFSRVAQLDEADGQYNILNFSNEKLIKYTRTLTPLLYHEFTHQLDNLTLLPDVQNYKERSRLIQFPTEIHAVRNELLIATGANSASINERYVNEDTLIDDGIFRGRFIDYLEMKFSEAKLAARKNYLLKGKNNADVSLAHEWVYELGRIEFSRTYATFDIDKTIDISFYKEYLGPDFGAVVDIVLQNPLDQNELAKLRGLMKRMLAYALGMEIPNEILDNLN